MGHAYPTRRSFLSTAGSFCLVRALPAQGTVSARASVPVLEHDHILVAAKAALAAPVETIDTDAAPHGEPGQFFSELAPDRASGAAQPAPAPALFRAHAELLRRCSAHVAALAAAFVLTGEPPYAARATTHLRAWLLTPGTRLRPEFDLAGCLSGTATGTSAGIVDLVPFAELARASSFLTDSPAWDDEDLAAIHTWWGDLLDWLNNSRPAVGARDSKDHRASAWLLIASAVSRFIRDETALETCRKRFRTPTLRNQIRPDGVFPQEVATPNPYRNTLFNFDLLAGACQLLASPFDLLWDYELIDGVGLRAVAAYLYPLIAHPERWPYISDAQHFRELPGRRPALLFAGRAYNRPEYVDVWQSLPYTMPSTDLAGTFPLQQPLLWTAKAPHGL